MRILTAGLGLLIVLLGLVGTVRPALFRSMFGGMSGQTRFVTAIVLRLALGTLLWFAAMHLRFPPVIRILAAISFAAAVAILIMGRQRLDALVSWWLSRSDGILRVSAAFAGLFGAFLVYVAT